jgi:hypothetical protein
MSIEFRWFLHSIAIVFVDFSMCNFFMHNLDSICQYTSNCIYIWWMMKYDNIAVCSTSIHVHHITMNMRSYSDTCQLKTWTSVRLNKQSTRYERIKIDSFVSSMDTTDMSFFNENRRFSHACMKLFWIKIAYEWRRRFSSVSLILCRHTKIRSICSTVYVNWVSHSFLLTKWKLINGMEFDLNRHDGKQRTTIQDMFLDEFYAWILLTMKHVDVFVLSYIRRRSTYLFMVHVVCHSRIFAYPTHSNMSISCSR